MTVRGWIRRALRDALGITRDQEEQAELAAGLRRDVDAIAATLQRVVRIQDSNTKASAPALGDLHRRLGTYERSIPSIIRAKRALDAHDAKKARAAAAAAEEATAAEQPTVPELVRA